MSATRDPSQKIGFVYSNLYHLYKKGQEAAQKSDPNPQAEPRPFGARAGLTTSRVIKAGDPRQAQVTPPQPFSQNRFPAQRPMPLALHQARSQKTQQSFDSLRDSLKSLQDLHGRLKFMLDELNDLIGEKK